MGKRKYINGVVLFVLTIQEILFTSPAKANCADMIADIQQVQPAMERLWQQLQTQTVYSWGSLRPYGQLSGDRITLTTDFDRLTGSQKTQVLESLYLDYNHHNWFDLLTPQEQQKALQQPGIGALSPYKVYASDGRAISLPYDGCTRTTLLTEKARYSWYSNFIKPNNPLFLRNLGYPSWRQVRFPISVEVEQKVRQQFWQTIGYKRANQDWWIAWVPEQGYFEINVPVNYQPQHLEKFWRIASTPYRYVVVDAGGTIRQKH